MSPFRGDLLIGGARLRGLDGEFEDRQEFWMGRFAIEPSRRELLETRRDYLLVLADGRAQKVVVTQMHPVEGQDAWVVEFRTCATSR